VREIVRSVREYSVCMVDEPAYARSTVSDVKDFYPASLICLLNKSLRTRATQDRRCGTVKCQTKNINHHNKAKHISSCGAVGSAYA
jgi:hypothetical protein